MIIAIVTGTVGTLAETLKRIERSVGKARERLGLRREETAVYGPRKMSAGEGGTFLQYRVARWNLPVWTVWRREPDMVLGEVMMEAEQGGKPWRVRKGDGCAGCVHARRSHARNGFGWWEGEGCFTSRWEE